ncbi:unnamed protein product [Pylaiella littoralis]
MFQGSGDIVVDIRLKRKDRTYRPNDVLEGTLVVNTPEAWDCKAINISMQGNVSLYESAERKGLFSDGPKPLALLHETINIMGAGRFPEGQTEIPFEAEIKGIDGMPLLNSYSGVYLSIGYHISAKIERGLMRNDLDKKIEFMVEVPGETPTSAKEVPFEISPETLEFAPKRYAKQRRLRPFRVTGRLDDATVSTSRPLTGEVVVEESERPIKSLEVQLVRVETVEQPQGQLREATEIQNLQIGEGDVCRGLVIPIYMVLPRLFSCPTMVTSRFRVEFELNVIVCFAEAADGYTATQNFQIILV